MDYAQLASDISFAFLPPDAQRGDDKRYLLRRDAHGVAKLLELPNVPVDIHNTELPAGAGGLRQELREICAIPRMSTFAVAALINLGVAQMKPGHAFVNVGTWNGFSFLSGLVGNADKTCVGVDNFSEWGGPRKAFMGRFDRLRSPSHRFHEMDYREYFSSIHSEPLGVYLYDGDHAYEHQRQGLEIAEPFFGDGCIVLVDDVNLPAPRQATIDFMAESDRHYSVLLDEGTALNGHPTFWNGLMVLRAEPERHEAASAATAGRAAEASASTPGAASPASLEPERADARVSIVLHHHEGGEASLEAALEAALNQTWGNVEVLVVDERGTERSWQAIAAFGDRVTAFRAGDDGAASLGRALEATSGQFVAFADTAAPLRPTAVSLGLRFPEPSRFDRPVGEPSYRWMERALIAFEEIATVVPPGEEVILVGDEMKLPRMPGSRRIVPFARPDADHLPPPPHDLAAIRRLESLRQRGANFAVFLWPAFWWLAYYGGLADHLRSEFRCVLENDDAVVFDLHL